MAVTLISLLILRFNYILSTDTMVMEFIKGKWGFLTNSGMLFPGDNTLFVWYCRSDVARGLAKKQWCWWLECRNLLPNFYFFSSFFYHHGNPVHLLICRLEVQGAWRTLRGKKKELKFVHSFIKMKVLARVSNVWCFIYSILFKLHLARS